MDVVDNRVESFTLRDGVGSLFRGAGQVMFQESVLSGAIFLLAIFVGAWGRGDLSLFWGALLSLLVATFAGLWLDGSKSDTRSGLMGFNAILCGCGFATFLSSGWAMWLSLILCSVLTILIRSGLNRLLLPYGVGSFTLPFVFSLWLFLLAAQSLSSMQVVGLTSAHFAHSSSSVINLGVLNLVQSWLRGISQVFLISSPLSGAIFLVGLFVADIRAGVWAMVASAVSMALAIAIGCSGQAVSAGLYGFSPVLTALALSLNSNYKGFRGAVWILWAVVLTLFVQVAMNSLVMPFGIPSLTFPFCITTLIFLLAEKKR